MEPERPAGVHVYGGASTIHTSAETQVTPEGSSNGAPSQNSRRDRETWTREVLSRIPRLEHELSGNLTADSVFSSNTDYREVQRQLDERFGRIASIQKHHVRVSQVYNSLMTSHDTISPAYPELVYSDLGLVR